MELEQVDRTDALDRRKLCISIAGMRITLLLGELGSADRARIVGRYADFAVADNRRTPSLQLRAEPGPPFVPFQNGVGWQIRTVARGNRIEFESHLEAGWIDRDTGQGSLVIRPEGNPENFLRVLYAWFCLENDAILLHAAGVIREGRGYVFFGPSGSGKTTISRLSLEQSVLSDDLVILKRHDGIIRVYGVPFRGDLPEAPRANASADLDGLFMLVKDSDHRIAYVPHFEAVAHLTSCVPFVTSDRENAERVIDICAMIEERTPVRALHFRPDPGFWRVIDEGH